MSTPVTTKPPDTADNTKPQRSLASRVLTRPEFGGKPVLTGPSIVDKTNIEQILPYTQKNTR